MDENDKRTKILEAAYDLLCKTSYQRLSMEQVAERAGVSKALLFYHFDSKRALARAALMQGFEREVEQFDFFQELDEATLRTVIPELLQFSLDRFYIIHAYIEIVDMDDPEDELMVFLHKLYAHILDMLGGFLESRGVGYPREKAMLLALSIDLFGVITHLEKKEPDVERYVNAILEMIDVEVEA
jgi:AcrR family transcriptional regulator